METSKKSRLTIFGLICLAISISIIAITFFPVIFLETRYWLNQNPSTKSLTQIILPVSTSDKPVDPEFGVIIPKIGANAKIVPNVDPYNAKIYQQALTKGVAHAENTAFPGQDGNIFIFSHSSLNFYEANIYNSIFYLLHKLEPGDEIILYYKNQKFVYNVTDKKLVDAKEVSYLKNNTTEKQLTLMTCWPPGTALKRLIVLATFSNN